MKSAKFKDSELGPIPEDWEVKRLGDIGYTVRGVSFTPSQMQTKRLGDMIALYRANNIQEGQLRKDEVIYVSPECVSEEQLLRSGDILVCAANGSKTLVGKSTIISETVDKITFGAFMAVFRSNQVGYSEYVGHYFHSNGYRAQVDDILTGSAISNLNPSSIKSIVIPFPPLPEQRRIAEALGAVDKFIDSLDAQIEKKRLIAKGVAHDLLSGAKRLPGFKEAWKRVRLGDIGEIIRGVSYSPNNAHSSFVDGTVKLLRANNVQEGRIIFNDLVYVDSQCVSQEQRMLRGDILICAANGSKELVGKAASIDYDFETTFGAFMMVLRPNSEITGKFLKHYFVSRQYRNQLDDVLTGSAINNLNGKAVCKFTVVLPVSLAEQQAIADLLGEQDAAIAVLEAKREKYARIKEGMMRDLLTGKVRMKGE